MNQRTLKSVGCRLMENRQCLFLIAWLLVDASLLCMIAGAVYRLGYLEGQICEMRAAAAVTEASLDPQSDGPADMISTRVPSTRPLPTVVEITSDRQTCSLASFRSNRLRKGAALRAGSPLESIESYISNDIAFHGKNRQNRKEVEA